MNRKRREAHVRRAMAAGCRPAPERAREGSERTEVEIPPSVVDGVAEPKQGGVVDATA